MLKLIQILEFQDVKKHLHVNLPNYLQIEQGDTIIWDNIGSVATTVTSGTPEDGA